MGRVAFAAFALTVTAFLGGCRPGPAPFPPPPKSARPPERQSELQMTAMHVQSYGDQGLEWEMNAPFGEVFTRKNVMRVKNLTVQLFDHGKKSTDISADSGLMSTGPKPDNDASGSRALFGVDLADGDMFLSGSVVMVSTDGSKMMTDWAHYHKKTDIITSTAPVRVERQDSTTTGIGMEASADMQRVHIFNETLVIPEKTTEGKIH